jgi:predicted HTH transcriptional regulator
MVPGLTEILQRAESEEFDRKSALDPTNVQDYLELVAHLVAMVNTRGGSILIGTQNLQSLC